MHSGTNAEQRFQNSTCENKLTAEGKQGFARKFTRFQNFPHFARDCTSPISVSSFPICSIPVQGFQNRISPRIDPRCLFAESPTTIKCHLSPFYDPPLVQLQRATEFELTNGAKILSSFFSWSKLGLAKGKATPLSKISQQ